MSKHTKRGNGRERCVCGATKEKKWHLLCPPCWERIPLPLQMEVYRLYREARGSRQHFEAIQRCLEIVRPQTEEAA